MSGVPRAIAGRSAARIVVGSLAVAALAACGGGGDDAPREADAPPISTAGETSSTSERETTTSTTTTVVETDVETVTRALQELAARYDAAVEGILTDPQVAGDDAHPAVRDYLALFVPDSEFASGALDSWAQQGSEGLSYRPGPRGRMSESTVVDVAVDEATRTATFSLCSLMSVEVVDAAGQPVSAEGGQTAATAVAELVGTEWLLRELSETSSDRCEPPAAGEETS